MAVRMRVENVALVTDGGTYSFDFSSRCTVLDGPVGTGKSSLVELVKHALGGSAILTPVTREHVAAVEALVLLNDERYSFRRRFGRDASYITISNDGSAEEGVRIPIKASVGQANVSDFVLNALGIPAVNIPRARSRATSANVPLTSNDLFSYLYVEQQEIDRSIVHHTETFREPKRRAMFELMFGLSDAAQLRAETELGKVRDNLRESEKRLEAVSNFLQTANVAEEGVLAARRLDLAAAEAQADRDLAHLRDDLSQITNAHQALRQRVADAQARANAASVALRDAQDELSKRERLLAQLQIDLTREDKARAASRRLSPLEFITCPRCLQDIDDARAAAHHCVLCLQPVQELPPDSAEVGSDEIDEQLYETAELLVYSRRSALRLEAESQQAEFDLGQLRAELDRVTAVAIAPRFQEIELLSAARAQATAGLEAVEQLLGFYREQNNIKANITKLTETKHELETFIEQAKARLSTNRSVIDNLSELFEETVMSIGVPWATSASIDPRTYLPLINNEPFETLAVAGGTKTVVTVAYHLTLLSYALANGDTLLPQMLIIDTPRKNLGSNVSDSGMGRRIYDRIRTLVDAYGESVQFIIADNDVPSQHDWVNVISFDYDHPLIPHVLHPGEEAAMSGQLETIGSK